MIEFLRTDRPLALESLLWGAYLFSRGMDQETLPPADLSPLNGFRIYVALLNRLTDRNWTTRFEAALARMRPKRTPVIIGWCSDALPCDWRNHEFYVSHAVYDSILDKHVHQKLYFSPAFPTTTTTGATSMTFLRAHAAVEYSPVLRLDETRPPKVRYHITTGIRSFAGTYLLYVDVSRAAVRNTLDCLNVAAPRLDTPGRVNSTPSQSVATSPVIKRVTLLIEFPC
jgi:hypothetical protein